MSSTTENKFLSPRFWPTWIGLLLLRGLSALPWRWVAVLSDALGALIYRCYQSRRAIAERNIASCFPDWSEERVSATAKRSFQLATQAMFLTGVSWWASPARYDSLVDCDAELLDDYMQQGRNVILLAPHFTALETTGIYLSKGRPMMTMYQYAKNALVNHFIVTRRGRFGGYLFERKEPLRKLIKLVRKGVPIYYLPDQDSGRRGRFVPFFGTQARTFDILGKLAVTTKAVVIPCTTEILPKGQGIRIRFGQPLADYPTGDDEQDTLLMNQAIEAMIQQMPEQYLWAHKRFKTRPEGEPDFYR